LKSNAGSFEDLLPLLVPSSLTRGLRAEPFCGVELFTGREGYLPPPWSMSNLRAASAGRRHHHQPQGWAMRSRKQEHRISERCVLLQHFSIHCLTHIPHTRARARTHTHTHTHTHEHTHMNTRTHACMPCGSRSAHFLSFRSSLSRACNASKANNGTLTLRRSPPSWSVLPSLSSW
jgi:hypothetical protein